jgi:hypothetical protein
MKRFAAIFAAAASVIAGLAFCDDVPANVPPSVSFTTNTSQALCVRNVGQSTTGFQLAATNGNATGPIDATMTSQSGVPDTAQIIDINGAVQVQPFTPLSGVNYRLRNQGAQIVCIKPDVLWDGATETAQATMWSNATVESFPAPGSSGNPANVVCNPACHVVVDNTPAPNTAPLTTPSTPPSVMPMFQTISGCQYSGSLSSPSPPPAVAGQIVAPRCSSDYILHTMRVFAGSSGVRYADTVPDAQATSSAVSGTGTITVKVISGVANHVTYLWFGSYVSTGTNTGTDTYSLIYGQTTTTPCDTNAHVIVPASAASSGASSGVVLPLYAGAVDSSEYVGGIYPASAARPIPAASPANDVCGQVVVITASNGYFLAAYAIP